MAALAEAEGDQTTQSPQAGIGREITQSSAWHQAGLWISPSLNTPQARSASQCQTWRHTPNLRSFIVQKTHSPVVIPLPNNQSSERHLQVLQYGEDLSSVALQFQEETIKAYLSSMKPFHQCVMEYWDAKANLSSECQCGKKILNFGASVEIPGT